MSKVNPLSYLQFVGFAVAADSYDRFMGRYSRSLSSPFADLAGVAPRQRVLDVGCGTGALTGELVNRVGAAGVVAVDPSTQFVAAARERHPGVEVYESSAENLPFANGTFDCALAQLVVHFMPDPVAGLSEMKRVTRTGGVVAACVWDFAGGRSPISLLWEAARQLDADVVDESDLAGARAGHLTELFETAGLSDVEEVALSVSVEHATFEDWWDPITLGVGPAGGYVAQLDEAHRTRLRELARQLTPEAPFTLVSTAWAARGST